MKLRSFILFLVIGAFISKQSAAQNGDVIRQQACVNDAFLPQIDSIKTAMAALGYTTVREASMGMESEYEMPVMAPLTQGAWYYFVFLGDITSKLYEVRMYDGSSRQVFYKKHQWGEIDGNIIGYPYIPQASEMHIVQLVQVNKKKKKDLCGYIMILKKVPAAG